MTSISFIVSFPKISTTFTATFVERIREEIFEWRQFGYDGVSETTKSLLNYWFNTPHENGFRYYFGQRESVESIIFLYEKLNVRENEDLLKFDSWGLSKNFVNDKWLRFVLKQATGTGKTKVLMLLITWSYIHKKFETQSTLSKNFLLISPNTIVLDRLKKDIDGLKVFHEDPIIPFRDYSGKNWNFTPTIHIQDDIGDISSDGNIFLTNIQRFANRKKVTAEDQLTDYFLGSSPVKQTLDNKIRVKI